MKDAIELKLATPEDAKLLHKLQVEAFLPLYEKYHDDDMSPAKEPLEKVRGKIEEPDSEFYIIQFEGNDIGGIRVRHYQNGAKVENVNWISPIFVIPEFQNRGIAQRAIQKVFELYPETLTWKLDTIKQEVGNCHLYEKCGFVRSGTEEVINEQMTLVEYEKKLCNHPPFQGIRRRKREPFSPKKHVRGKQQRLWSGSNNETSRAIQCRKDFTDCQLCTYVCV